MPALRFLLQRRELLGILLVAAGEALIAIHHPPVSYYYFPVIWYGYILTLDGFLQRSRGVSLIGESPLLFLAMIPISAGIWWLFEGFNLAVGNWRYLPGGVFTGFAYVALASTSFSTVLPAVWLTALTIRDVLPASGQDLRDDCTSGRLLLASETTSDRAPASIHAGVFCLGIICLILPVLAPRYAFGLIWGALFLLLDPVNHALGRSSLVDQIFARRLETVMAFALAGPVCGFFWEAWNYWASIKWVYHVPFVSQWHLFEMPVPGYLGYVPFGLELYALAVLLLPPLGSPVSRVTAAWSPKMLRSRATAPD